MSDSKRKANSRFRSNPFFQPSDVLTACAYELRKLSTAVSRCYSDSLEFRRGIHGTNIYHEHQCVKSKPIDHDRLCSTDHDQKDHKSPDHDHLGPGGWSPDLLHLDGMSSKFEIERRVNAMKPETIKTAWSIQKPKKNEIIDQLDEVEKIDEFLAAQLYRYFVVKPSPKKAKTDDIAWLSLAVSSDPKFTLEYIQVLNGVASATDSHRLHVAYDTGLGDGYYDTRGNKLAEIDNAEFRFPNVSCVIRGGDNYKPMPELKPYNFKTKNSGDIFTKISAVKIGKAQFNYQFIQDAIAGNEDGKYSIGEDERLPIQILTRDGSRLAVIMPLWD